MGLAPTPNHPSRSWLAETEMIFTWMVYIRAFQPAARGPHAAREAILCGPRTQMLPYIFWINEIVKPEYTILWSFGSINPLLFLIRWSLIVKILQKIYKSPLILLHAARLMTRLTGVWPAVDLSWKALVYMPVSKDCQIIMQDMLISCSISFIKYWQTWVWSLKHFTQGI